MSLLATFFNCKHPIKEGDFVVLYKKARGLYTFDMLADDISHSCSLTRSDVAGCMEALIQHTTARLLDGYNVQYLNFGVFQITLDTNMLTKEQFEHHRIPPKSVIKDYKIRFTPCTKLRNKVRREAEIQLIQ